MCSNAATSIANTIVHAVFGSSGANAIASLKTQKKRSRNQQTLSISSASSGEPAEVVKHNRVRCIHGYDITVSSACLDTPREEVAGKLSRDHRKSEGIDHTSIPDR